VRSHAHHFCLCFPCFSAKLELALHQMQQWITHQISVKILGQEKIPKNTCSVYLLFEISVDKKTCTESFGRNNFWFN